MAFVLALMLLVMIPLSQCQAAKIAGIQNKVKARRLQFVDNARGTWQKLSGDKMKARFTVTNPSEATKTVKAFELYLYATDVWGDRIYGDSVYYWTTKKNIAPGKSAYSDYCTIPDRSDVDQLHVAIKKFVYTDGTIVEIEEKDLNYWKWTVTWND